MNVIKKLSAILSIALIVGLGIFGVSKAINAQETQNENTKQQETKRKDKRESEERQDKKGDREENESSEKEDADEETADDNEREEADSDEQSEQAALARQATVSKEQAQTVALQRVAGDVLKSELEDEDGRVVYGFEIRDANGKVFDVKIDAKTGAFVKASADDGGEEKGETSESDEQNETEND
jgi:uncharacterized membrane protein YkoI